MSKQRSYKVIGNRIYHLWPYIIIIDSKNTSKKFHATDGFANSKAAKSFSM